MNSEKARLIKQDNVKTHCLEFLGPFKESQEEYLSTALEGEHRGNVAETCETMAWHCHTDKEMWPKGDEKLLARKKLLLTAIICLVFIVGEVIGGYFAHSLAVMTDAAHLLTDFGSILISLFSLWLSSRPPTKTFTFGWHRSEVLGAVLSVLSIWVVTAVLVFIAIQRIIDDDYEIHSEAMLITSGCAVLVNILMAFILHQSPASHSHGPTYLPASHITMNGHSHCHGSSGSHSNTSVRAAFVHVVGDLLQSLGVLLAATIIYFRPEWKMADPICTFLFSVFVLGTTFTILKDVTKILMAGSPQTIDFDSVKDLLVSVRGVKAAHNLHIWTLTMNQVLLTVHLVIERDTHAQTVLSEATKRLLAEFGIHDITIQLEAYTDDMAFCMECQGPHN